MSANSNGDGSRKDASRGGGNASNSCIRRIGGVRSGVVIFVSTVLVLFFTWKSQFVDNKQGWQVGNHLDAIEEDRFEVTVTTKNVTKVAKPKSKKSVSEKEKESRTDKPKAAATREKAPIQKEQEAAKNNDIATVYVEKQTAETAGKGNQESVTVTTDVADKNRSDNDGEQKEEKKQKQQPKMESNGDEEDARKRGESIKQKQIENYRNEKALMINVHATHHAGTTFCGLMGRHGINGGIAPGFVCMGDKEMVMPDPPDWCDPSKDPYCYSFYAMQKKNPWAEKETGPFVEAIRPYFHMVSWEFGGANKKTIISQTDWEHPNVVSVVITRDPLTRLMASGGDTTRKYPGYNTQKLSLERWWDFAVYDGYKGSDNFFLRILLGKPNPHSEAQTLIRNHIEEGVNRTTEEVMELYPTKIWKKDFERARSLLDRFTFVLDIHCLIDGIEAMRDALSLEPPPPDQRELKHRNRDIGEGRSISETSKLKKELKKLPTRERIGHDDVYEYLVAKNQWDIALYEYSKTISLVRCE